MKNSNMHTISVAIETQCARETQNLLVQREDTNFIVNVSHIEIIDERETQKGRKINNINESEDLGKPLPTSPYQGESSRWDETERFKPIKKRKSIYGVRVDIASEEVTCKKISPKQTSTSTSKTPLTKLEEAMHSTVVKRGRRKRRRSRRGNKSFTKSSKTTCYSGKGWRYCRQAITRNSLCERHAGKPKLQGMTNVSHKGAIFDRKSRGKKNIINMNGKRMIKQREKEEGEITEDEEDEL
ncbi:hypothetical protein H6P81_017084 [Aristolochia fimbriata]|uniref:WRC domain-containing protein n=1 Tax=Aristolochia fimbriata TaxID=158543 RepID=A0AAV7DX38_ARIFI|nr:hypothetical protein H6P81_017084 [Aristolochia fimbriata]